MAKKGKVILNKKVYRQMVAACVRFANKRIPEENWLEVYGILIGRNDKKGNVIVTEAYAITHTKKKGHILKVSYDDPDYVDAALIEEEAISRDPPEFIVGWFHSHPGIKVMFSQDDKKNQLGFQTNNPLAIAPVFNPVRLMRQVELGTKKGDPVKPLKNDPGFKIYRLKDINHPLGDVVEVDYEFADAEINEEFIKEAQQFAQDVARLLPPKNFVEKTRDYLEKQLNKIREIYVGTESYVNTLVKKGDTSRIPGIIEMQMSEMDKILQPTLRDIELLKELMYYVEYKERGETIYNINQAIENFNSGLEEIKEKFEALKSRF